MDVTNLFYLIVFKYIYSFKYILIVLLNINKKLLSELLLFLEFYLIVEIVI